MAHAPGPWSIADNREMNGALWIEAAHPEGFNVSIAEVRQGCGEADEISDLHSNANLIASAPEMLQCLTAAYHALRSYQLGNDATDLACEIADACGAAILLATGEAPRP